MNFYETLFIIHPALESGHLKDILNSIDENLKSLGCKTLSVEIWGKKRLAYLIENQKYGTYVQFQFSGNGSGTRDFETELQHNANVLSYLTTSISKAEIIEQENDIETQIAGHSREGNGANVIEEKKTSESENQDSKKETKNTDELADKEEKKTSESENQDSKKETKNTDELADKEVATSEKEEKPSDEETNVNVEENNSTESNEE